MHQTELLFLFLIVTEGHYDASFESEVLPVGPRADGKRSPSSQQSQQLTGRRSPSSQQVSQQQSVSAMTSIDSNTAVSSVGGLPGGLPPGSVALPPNTSINSQSGNNLTYSASMKNKPRAPPLAHSAKKSVFSLSGLSDHQNSVAASSGLGVKCNPGMGEDPQGGLRIGNGPHQAGRGSNPGQHVTTTSAVVSAAVSGASQQQQSNIGSVFGPISFLTF